MPSRSRCGNALWQLTCSTSPMAHRPSRRTCTLETFVACFPASRPGLLAWNLLLPPARALADAAPCPRSRVPGRAPYHFVFVSAPRLLSILARAVEPAPPLDPPAHISVPLRRTGRTADTAKGYPQTWADSPVLPTSPEASQPPERRRKAASLSGHGALGASLIWADTPTRRRTSPGKHVRGSNPCLDPRTHGDATQAMPHRL